jgi:hypothetical protein
MEEIILLDSEVEELIEETPIRLGSGSSTCVNTYNGTIKVDNLSYGENSTQLGVDCDLSIAGSTEINGSDTNVGHSLYVNSDLPVKVKSSSLYPSSTGGEILYNGSWYVGIGPTTPTKGPSCSPDLTFWCQQTSVTVVNTTTESTLLSTGHPNLYPIIPANTIEEGSTLNVRCNAVLYSRNTATTTMRFYFNSTLLTYDLSPMTMPNIPSTTPAVAEFNVWIQFVDTGHCRVIGRSLIGTSSSWMRNIFSGTPASPVSLISIDTTIDQRLNVTYQWSEQSTNDSVTVYIVTMTSFC